MSEVRWTRLRVGRFLVAVGLVTLLYMILANSWGWPSLSLANLVPLGIGIVLLVGRLGTMRAMNWLIALYLTFIAGWFAVTLIVEPWPVTRAAYMAHPQATAWRWLYQLCLVVVLVWAYRSLRSPAVLEAMAARGVSTARPRVALILGCFTLFGGGALEYKLTYSDEALAARAQASLVHGIGRVYDVASMRVGEGKGSAILKAYGPDGVDFVAVHWGDPVEAGPPLIRAVDACGPGQADQGTC